MKNNFYVIIRKYIEFFLLYLFYLISSFLSINLVSFLGGSIFRLIGPYTKTHQIVKKNIIQIIPLANKTDIKNYSKKSWNNIGKTFFELMVLPRIISSNQKITIEGKEIINTIINNKEKVIFVGIHQSNWEILLPSIDKLGIPLTGIYRHINNPYINKLILKIRNKSIFSKKSFYTPKGKKSAKDIIENIKKNKSIILLVDQKDSAGEKVSFFGFPAKTQIGFIKIARKYNMKIIPVENLRNKNNNFTLKFHEPIRIFDKKKSDSEVMIQLHQVIEKWIQNDVSNWFLQHNRFN